MLKKTAVVVLALVAIGTFAGCGSTSSSEKTRLDQAEATELGTQLINGYWNTLSCDDTDSVEYESLLDPGFQAVTVNGSMNKDAVVAALAAACISSTEIKDIVVTAAPDTLMVAYKARRTVNGAQSQFQQLVNVFVKNGNEWDGVVSANSGNVPS
jgi:predicted component of type VI protein secretion system